MNKTVAETFDRPSSIPDRTRRLLEGPILLTLFALSAPTIGLMTFHAIVDLERHASRFEQLVLVVHRLVDFVLDDRLNAVESSGLSPS